MSGPNMYNVQSAAVDPIENLLKALVLVNYYAKAAQDGGWDCTFSVGAAGLVNVGIARDHNWPSPRSEAEAAQ